MEFIGLGLLAKLAKNENNLGFTIAELTIALAEGQFYRHNATRKERDLVFLCNIAPIPNHELSRPRARWLEDIQNRVAMANRHVVTRLPLPAVPFNGNRAVIVVPSITDPTLPA